MNPSSPAPIATAAHEGILLDTDGMPIETWGGKFQRRFKENPFVPIFAGLTTASLIMASTKLRKRQSTSMNYWFRVRVLMQGLTLVAVVGGSWYYGQMKHQKDTKAAAEQERLIERLAFEARLRAAEEADQLEKLEAAARVKMGAGWFGGWWGKSAKSSEGDGKKEA